MYLLLYDTGTYGMTYLMGYDIREAEYKFQFLYNEHDSFYISY